MKCLLVFLITSFVKYLLNSFTYFSWGYQYFIDLGGTLFIYSGDMSSIDYMCYVKFPLFCGLILINKFFKFYFSKLFDVSLKLRDFCVLI